MIRVNLLEQPLPQAPARVVPPGLLQGFVFIALLALAVGYLALEYARMGAELAQAEQQIAQKQATIARLNKVKQEVATFRQEKQTIDQRIALVHKLSEDRVTGQQLLAALALTVNQTDSLWLTAVSRQGSGLKIEGEASSITAVARFMSDLEHSGHFNSVQITAAHQDEASKDTPIFIFTLTAVYQTPQAALATQAAQPPAAAARKS
jgi:Tfp pilus assembly protein PilN